MVRREKDGGHGFDRFRGNERRKCRFYLFCAKKMATLALLLFPVKEMSKCRALNFLQKDGDNSFVRFPVNERRKCRALLFLRTKMATLALPVFP